MAYTSAYRFLAEFLHTALTREGVQVGNTASVPRVECHTFIENTPSDKAGAVRVVSVIVESMSNRSPEEAAAMNAGNLAAIQAAGQTGTDYKVVGAVPTQLQELTEASDTQIVLHRVLQTIDFYIQQL